MRVAASNYARFEAQVAKKNAQAKRLGLPPSLTVGTLVRLWAEERLDVEEGVVGASVVERVPEVQAEDAPRSEPELEGGNGRHSDETQVREPVHRKRVRAPVVPSGPITEQSTSEPDEPEEESGPPGDEDLEALLRDTPL